MRKVVAIGLLGFAICSFAGAGYSSLTPGAAELSQQYTHLIETNQSQIREALSQTLSLELPDTGSVSLRNFSKLAGVHFIVGNNGQTFADAGMSNEFDDPTGEYCKKFGFTINSCASGLFNRACPYNDRIYDKCCEASYTYEASNCPAPRKLSSETCGGKHRCYCDTAQYPFASCSDPQIKGNACTDDGGTRYATCVCPNPVSTPYGCETYYAAPCGSVCKKAYADNCRNRTAVQTPYGCEKYFADCSSKCEKAYSDNCRNRNAVSAPYGCRQVYGDCQSKCEVAYPDNCHNRTAAIASCPANATCSYFADCAAKIQSWTCNSGYKQSGNSCVVEYNCSQQYSYYKNINDKMQFALLRNSCKGNYTTWSTIAPIKMGETCSQFGMRMYSEITAHNNKCPSNRITPIRRPRCSSCCDGGRNGIGALYMCREDDMGMGGIR